MRVIAKIFERELRQIYQVISYYCQLKDTWHLN